MRLAALFLWILVPVALWVGYATYGTPHVVGHYRFHDNGDIYNPHAARRYIDCTYYGWAGVITVPAKNEHCPWIRFFRAES
ncbi:hypothetical protein ACOTTU_19220 [Roseobacter sp. EG26]|uniref:hypothetical protein n=1 Tax=Roseobacter sp. EG26 TaxID=3412477 RepID=UPI003CE559E9